MIIYGIAIEENGQEITDAAIAKVEVEPDSNDCIVTIGEKVIGERTLILTATFIPIGDIAISKSFTIETREKSVPNYLDYISLFIDDTNKTPSETAITEVQQNTEMILNTAIWSQNSRRIVGKVQWSVDNENVVTYPEEAVDSDENDSVQNIFTVVGEMEDIVKITATVVDDNVNPVKDKDGKDITKPVNIVVIARAESIESNPDEPSNPDQNPDSDPNA